MTWYGEMPGAAQVLIEAVAAVYEGARPIDEATRLVHRPPARPDETRAWAVMGGTSKSPWRRRLLRYARRLARWSRAVRARGVALARAAFSSREIRSDLGP